MRHITANIAQRDFGNVLDNVTRFNEPYLVILSSYFHALIIIQTSVNVNC